MRLFAAISLFVLACVVPFSGKSLQKGQVIKQFETYSVAEFLARDPTGIFRTQLPCFGGVRWVHELPLFEEVGAVFIRVLPSWPAVTSLLGLVVLAWTCLLFLSHQTGANSKRLFFLSTAATLTPIVARYSIQFTPDLYGAAALILGAKLLFEKKRTSAVICFAAGVAFKALFGAPALALLTWDALARPDPGRALAKQSSALAARGLVVVLPYVAWSVAQAAAGVAGDSSAQAIFKSNDFLGPISLLSNPLLYRRWFTWMVLKGAGPALCAIATVGWLQSRAWRLTPRIESYLFWWFLASIPYFLLIRQANIIHDYYCLGFTVPIALQSVLTVHALLTRKHELMGLALWAICVGWAVWGLARLQPVELGLGQWRPLFCGVELFGDALGRFMKSALGN